MDIVWGGVERELYAFFKSKGLCNNGIFGLFGALLHAKAEHRHKLTVAAIVLVLVAGARLLESIHVSEERRAHLAHYVALMGEDAQHGSHDVGLLPEDSGVLLLGALEDMAEHLLDHILLRVEDLIERTLRH